MSSENGSGMVPVEFKCVVLPDQPKEVTRGGLVVPEVVRDKEKHRAVKAVLVACGGNAFDDWNGTRPEVGQRVYVAVGAGIIFKGPDGKEYRIINDKDIAGVIFAEASE